MLLALLGTALMAIVIFAPAPNTANATVSLAPPHAPPLPPEFWIPRYAEPADHPLDDYREPPPREPIASQTIASHADLATWPALVDARAGGCDAAARLALVDALAAVRAPWADAILRRALDDEPDARVRAAVVAALS